ncbi:dermatopontin-like [Branchiostoma floridae x Branchiostoma japonicum]
MFLAFSTLILLAGTNAAPSTLRVGEEVLLSLGRARRHAVEATTNVSRQDVALDVATTAPTPTCDTTGKETGFGDPFTFECAKNQVISSVTSSYCSSPSDRAWAFGCKVLTGENLELNECFWSPFINDFGGIMAFQCPFNSLITGFYSTFRDDKNDRRWKVKCCRPGSYLAYNCLTTIASNEWNDDLNFSSPSGYFMRGIHSDVSTGKRDRRYQFDLCKMKKTVNRDRYHG